MIFKNIINHSGKFKNNNNKIIILKFRNNNWLGKPNVHINFNFDNDNYKNNIVNVECSNSTKQIENISKDLAYNSSLLVQPLKFVKHNKTNFEILNLHREATIKIEVNKNISFSYFVIVKNNIDIDFSIRNYINKHFDKNITHIKMIKELKKLFNYQKVNKHLITDLKYYFKLKYYKNEYNKLIKINKNLSNEIKTYEYLENNSDNGCSGLLNYFMGKSINNNKIKNKTKK